jgi:hypothetical protein
VVKKYGTLLDTLTMTTFIPSLTLPAAVFANPAASILLPIGLGTVVGFSVQRMYRGKVIIMRGKEIDKKEVETYFLSSYTN